MKLIHSILLCCIAFLGIVGNVRVTNSFGTTVPVSDQELHFWDFTLGTHGWVPNGSIGSYAVTEEGLDFDCTAEDPHITGPLVSYPFSKLSRVTVRMRSDADPHGKIFFGETFTEERSSTFTVVPDGDWYEYSVYIKSLFPQARLRLDPCHFTGRITVAWIRVENVPDPTLDNGRVEIRMDLQVGGSISHLSQSSSGRNLVNLHDRGRFIQQSYYAGQSIDRRSEGQSPSWSPWPWNPIQVGDAYGNSSRILAAWVQDGTAYTKCQPLLWDMNNELAECYMEMWVTLHANTVHVKNRLTCFRTDSRWGLTPNHQELPAVYTIGDLYHLVTFTGNDPWNSKSTTEITNNGPPWEYWTATEHWAAFLDDQGFGVGVYNGGATSFVGGFHDDPGGGPYSNSTGYIAPLTTEMLGKTTVFEYEYDLVVGTLHDIRNFVYGKEGVVYSGGPTSTPAPSPTVTATPTPTPPPTGTPTPTFTPSSTFTPTQTPTRTPTPSSTSTSTPTRISPNLIRDSIIDVKDLLEFLRRWNGTRELPLLDLNGDRRLDGLDPMMVGRHWYQVTAP